MSLKAESSFMDTPQEHRTDGRAVLEKRRVIIAERDPRERERLRHSIHELGLDIAGLAADGQELVQMATLLHPDFVLLDESLPVLGALDAAAALQQAAPDVATILMSARVDASMLREAMQNGVRDVVSKPLDLKELNDSLHKLNDIHRILQSQTFRTLLDPARLPSVFCVTGGKGGVGKTMVATNLALALSQVSDKTVLVDLYTQFGDVAATLNMKPQRTLAELANMADDIDATLLANYVHKHESGLNVLFGSDRPLPLDAISAASLDRIVGVLKRDFKYIVFDVPPYLHATTLHAMSMATSVLLVCNLFDFTTIADTKQLFDTLKGAYVSQDRIKLLVNRVTGNNKFQAPDIERTFGHPVFAQLPNEPKVVSLLNTGYASHDSILRTDLGQAMKGLAESLMDPSLGPPSPISPGQAVPQKPGAMQKIKSMFGNTSS